MYFIALVVVLLIALAIFFSPLFSVILLVLFLIGLGLYKFFGPGTEPEHASPEQTPATGKPVRSGREEVRAGIWGEKGHDQREGQEPS
jgi:hypothetical protein